MDLSAMIVFATALFIAAAVPGPSIAALVARVLVRGWRDVLPFVAAMWIGEVLWLTLAIAGLTAIAQTFHWAFLAIKYCGVAYLVYLAWHMWHAPVDTTVQTLPEKARGGLHMFLTGLAVTGGNPKIMIFYLALLPSIIDLAGVTFSGWAGLAAIVLIVLALVDLSYIALAVRARVFLRSPFAMRLANRLSATVLAGAAAAIATR